MPVPIFPASPSPGRSRRARRLGAGWLILALGACIAPPLAELDDQQSISLYIGNVEVEQGSMRILADEVLVHHRPNRQPRKIIAVGNPVRYRQALDDDPREVKGRALRMEYEADRDEITLIDEAELTQGEDRFASDRIVYNRVTARVTAGSSAEGRERVKIRIEPRDK